MVALPGYAIAKEARRNSDLKGPTNFVTRLIRDLMLKLFLRIGNRSAERVSSYRVDWNDRPG